MCVRDMTQQFSALGLEGEKVEKNIKQLIVWSDLISKWCEYSLTPSSSDKSWQVIELVLPRPEEQLSVGV